MSHIDFAEVASSLCIRLSVFYVISMDESFYCYRVNPFIYLSNFHEIYHLIEYSEVFVIIKYNSVHLNMLIFIQGFYGLKNCLWLALLHRFLILDYDSNQAFEYLVYLLSITYFKKIND